MNLLVKILNRIYNRLYPNERNTNVKSTYLGNPILNKNAGNLAISDLIKSNKPFAVGRIGSTELYTITNYLEIEYFNSDVNFIKKKIKKIKGWSPAWNNRTREMIHKFSGVFPTDDKSLDSFSKIYLHAISNLDTLGVWYNYNEDVISNRFCPNATLIPLESIEPYFFEEPWSQHLINKKVLVIHPFDKSIQHQHKNHALLFQNKKIYPTFELKTIRAVQSIANNSTPFKTWFDALDYMKSEIAKTDFDIAIIGAGAYGLPLAAYVKQIGKQAIHIGGATQLLFGIKGARWENYPEIYKLYNEHWNRPLLSEKPEGFNLLENGTFW